jgi:hypothetical protein
MRSARRPKETDGQVQILPQWESFAWESAVGGSSETGKFGASGDGWSVDTIQDTSIAGRMHGPWGMDGLLQLNEQVSKQFLIPRSAARCTVAFRSWRFADWEDESNFLYVDDKMVWMMRGDAICENSANMSDLGNPQFFADTCATDVAPIEVDCSGGGTLRFGFSSSIDEESADESWAFSNFELVAEDVAGGRVFTTVADFGTKWVGVPPKADTGW